MLDPSYPFQVLLPYHPSSSPADYLPAHSLAILRAVGSRVKLAIGHFSMTPSEAARYNAVSGAGLVMTRCKRLDASPEDSPGMEVY